MLQTPDLTLNLVSMADWGDTPVIMTPSEKARDQGISPSHQSIWVKLENKRKHYVYLSHIPLMHYLRHYFL